MRCPALRELQREGFRAVRRGVYCLQERRHDDLLDSLQAEGSTIATALASSRHSAGRRASRGSPLLRRDQHCLAGRRELVGLFRETGDDPAAARRYAFAIFSKSPLQASRCAAVSSCAAAAPETQSRAAVARRMRCMAVSLLKLRKSWRPPGIASIRNAHRRNVRNATARRMASGHPCTRATAKRSEPTDTA